jgi:hypothetical protein
VRIGALAALALGIGAASASAAVTLGQLSPAPGGLNSNFDFVPANVATGASYVVPANGTITSWSINAAPSPGTQSASMKVYRKIGDPSFFQVIGLDGPHTLQAGLINPFTVSIPVQAGDVIGCTANGGGAPCLFPGTAADSIFARGIPPAPALLGLGDQASFGSATPNNKVNVQATFEPTPPATPAATPPPVTPVTAKKCKKKHHASAAKKCKKKR